MLIALTSIVVGIVIGILLINRTNRPRRCGSTYTILSNSFIHPCECGRQIRGIGPLRESDQKEVCWSCYTVDKYKDTFK